MSVWATPLGSLWLGKKWLVPGFDCIPPNTVSGKFCWLVLSVPLLYQGGVMGEELVQRPSLISEKKRSGSKCHYKGAVLVT